jgi:hypothetical protein
MATATRPRTSNQRVGSGGSSAPNPSAGTGLVLTAPEIAAMSPSQRAAYMQSLDSGQQAALASARAVMNHNYMMRALRKVAICPPTAGGVTMNYVLGQQLVYNFPTATGGFAKELLFTLNTVLNFATGTGALYAANAAAPLNMIDTVNVLYNGVQGRLRPVFQKYVKQLRGFQRPAPGIVIAGTSNATIQAQMLPTLTYSAGAQTFLIKFRIPLNALHDLAPAGMLPIQGSSTQAQVQVNCASALLGNDPLLQLSATTGGTGPAITVTSGTLLLECVYTDGQNLQSLQPVVLDLISQPAVPTAQYIIDTTLSPLLTGSVQRQKIQALLEHFYVICCVIDGQQSAKYSTVANINGFELDEDPVGQNKFWAYGTGTNQPIYDYYENIRQFFGQDMDEGIFVMTAAPNQNQANPSNNDGAVTLNMLPGAWTATSHGWQVTAVNGVANATARVETWLISRNPQGLLLA